MSEEKGIRLEFAQFGHFDSFEVFRSLTSMAALADHELPAPIATGLKTMRFIDQINLKSVLDRDLYYRVRVIRGNQSLLSDELQTYISTFNAPQNLIVAFANNALEMEWDFENVTELHYYCSESPIDIENLPSPKAVLAGDVRTYIDTEIEVGKAYYVRVGSVKNGVEKLSSEIEVYAFNSNLFAINSDFESNLIDKTGKVWTAHGNANVSNGKLNLGGMGDYLTTPASNDYHFNNSEDVTIRFKVKINSFKASNIATIFSTYSHVPGDPNYSVRVLNNSIMMVMWSAQNPTWSYSIPLGIEKEISIERESMIWRLYVDGVQIGSTFTQTSNYTKDIATAYLGSGIYEAYGSERDLNGALSNFQIIKGLAVGGGQSTTPRI